MEMARNDSGFKGYMNNKNKLAVMLRLKPNMSEGFRPISKWDKIVIDQLEREALQIFLKGQNQPDNPEIKNNKSRAHVISYLRYDFKKILMRMRSFYLDNNEFEMKNSFYILKIEPLIGYGFFEPLANCFICAESMGHFKNYSDDSIEKLLADLDDGYKIYAKVLADFFRNGLVHRFRPYGAFNIDLNTEGLYTAPCMLKGCLKINVPHFIDSLIFELENLISELKSATYEARMNSYLMDINDIEAKSKYFKNAIRNPMNVYDLKAGIQEKNLGEIIQPLKN